MTLVSKDDAKPGNHIKYLLLVLIMQPTMTAILMSFSDVGLFTGSLVSGAVSLTVCFLVSFFYVRPLA